MTTRVLSTFSVGNDYISHHSNASDDSTWFQCKDHVLAKIDNEARMFVGATFVGKFYLDNQHKWYFKYFNQDTIKTTTKELISAEVEVFTQMHKRKLFGVAHNG